MKRESGALGAALSFALAFTFAAPAKAAELHILVSGAFKSAMADIKPLFEQATEHKVTFDADTSGRIATRIAGGEQSDFIVSTNDGVDDLIKTGKAQPDSKLAIARAGVGMVVRKGAPKPDISTPEKFKQALLDAKTVAYTNPASGGQSGVYFVKLLAQLGLTETINAKAKFGDGGPIALIVARGDAEIGMQPVPELLSHVKEVDFVGPLPTALQSYNNLTAAIPSNSKQPDAAHALLKFLATPAAQAVMTAKGLEPG
jgi:molybdate transport system substrate-binding protein